MYSYNKPVISNLTKMSHETAEMSHEQMLTGRLFC